MGYRGRIQTLCDAGHYGLYEDPNGYSMEPANCSFCHKPFAWKNYVDDTNVDSYYWIEIKKFLIAPPSYEKCNLGHDHMIQPAVYRIPTSAETVAEQMKWQSDSSFPQGGVWEYVVPRKKD